LKKVGLAYVALFATWFALVGVRDSLELGVGVAAAAAAVAVAAAIRVRAGFPGLPVRARSWSRARAPLARIPADLWRLAAARGAPRGSLRTATLPQGTNWHEHAERGLAGVIASVAPNAIVLDLSGAGTATYHELVETSERLLP
jgi:hypothetical protein